MSLGVGALSVGAGLAYFVGPKLWHRPAAPGAARRIAARTIAAARRPRRRGGLTVVAVDKAIDVRVPPAEAFAAWGRIENLPRFVPHVREVRETAVDRHHWIVGAASAPPIEWDTRITRFGSNRVVAWETLPGTIVRHAGSIHFRPNADRGTRVALRLSYVVPPGPFGEQVAAMVQTDDIDQAVRRWKAEGE